MESCGFSRVCSPDSGVNVSAVDTTPVTPHPFGPLASWTTSLPRVPARAGVSEVMTLTCLRSEETAHLTKDSRRKRIAGVLESEDARDQGGE